MRFPRVWAIGGVGVVVAALVVGMMFAGKANAAPQHASSRPAVSFYHSCPAAAVGAAYCHALYLAQGAAIPGARPGGGGSTSVTNGCPTNPTAGNTYPGYTACDVESAYNLASASGSNGSGETVAIVDAYNDPNAFSDVNTYRSEFGIPLLTNGTSFKQVNQTGGSKLPRSNGGWAQEISLDLDMVSAVCPNCNILLVEASSNSNTNLFTAEDYAASHASYVSNSYGESEFSGETSDDVYFNHPGVVITVSSGDGGYGVDYPAASPYVTAVGGTSLTKCSSTRGWCESVWSTSNTEGAGSGCSAYEPQQSWQNIANITGNVDVSGTSTLEGNCSRRAVADVSATADPYHGVDVYDSYSYQGQSGWLVFGGTSVASPITASVYALAGNASSVTYGSYPYSHTSSLYDVTSGQTSNCGSDLCTAVPGWDGPTGLGTPDGIGGY
jgi:subtilase family serine protease